MLYAIKLSSFLCFALIHNVTLRVKGFRGKTPTLHGPKRLGQPPPRNAKSARLAAFDKMGNVFSFTYSQMTAQQFRQLDLYFMKIGHEINCCVFKSCECREFYISDNFFYTLSYKTTKESFILKYKMFLTCYPLKIPIPKLLQRSCISELVLNGVPY